MDNGSMTEERRRMLDANLPAWNQRLRIDCVVAELLANAVFNEHIVDLIRNERTCAMRSYEFIRQLKMRGNNAFESFYNALLSTNQRSLARLLEDGLKSNDEGGVNKRNGEYCNRSGSENIWTVNENGNQLGNQQTLTAKEHRPFEEQCNEPPMEEVTVNAIEENRMYYVQFSDIRAKEPSGILRSLHVESVDNRSPTDRINFDEQLMYPNFSSPRGMALIINNRRFETMPERLGTDVDEANLSQLFTQLGYSLLIYRNLCSKEMVLGMREFARRHEHSSMDSSVVCVLSHGEHGEVFGVDDQGVSVMELVSLLNANNCPSLAHKPKLFFLQACRGQRYDKGFAAGHDSGDGLFDRFFSCTTPQNNGNMATDHLVKSPTEADIMISYATTPGYVSWRNSMKGSWFVQSICEVFSKHANHIDLLSMLTMVSKRVAEAYESTSGAYKQIPDHSSRLRRNFYFFPGMSRPASISYV